MALDFFRIFRRKGGRRQSGRRRGAVAARAPHAQTEAIASGPPPVAGAAPPAAPPVAGVAPPPPAYAPPPAAAPGARTEMAPGGLAPPTPMAPVRPSALPPPPIAAGGDSEKTRYTAAPAAAGSLVGVLIALEGELTDQLYRVYDGENGLGRGDNQRIALKVTDRSISREHAVIIHQDGAFGIRSLKGDDNPTILNGEPVPDGAMLSDGDTLKLGSVTFRFRTV